MLQESRGPNMMVILPRTVSLRMEKNEQIQ